MRGYRVGGELLWSLEGDPDIHQIIKHINVDSTFEGSKKTTNKYR